MPTMNDTARTIAAFDAYFPELADIKFSISVSSLNLIGLSCWRSELSHKDFATICRIFGNENKGIYKLEHSAGNGWLSGFCKASGLSAHLTVYGAIVCTPLDYSTKHHHEELSNERILEVQKEIDRLQAGLDTGDLTTTTREVSAYKCIPVTE